MTDIAGDITSTTFLAPGGTLASNIDFNYDVDFVGTSLVAGFAYGFLVSKVDDTRLMAFKVFNADGTSASETGLSSLGRTVFGFTPEVTGNYFVSIGAARYGETGEYSLSISADDTLLNSTASTQVLAVGETFDSKLDAPGDVDVLAVVLAPGLFHEFSLTSPDGNGNLELEMIDDHGNVLLESSSIGFGGATGFWFTPSPEQDLFLRISAYSSGSSYPIEYTLGIETEDTIPGSPALAVVLAEGETAQSSIEGSSDYRHLDADVFAPILTPGLLYEFVLTSPDPDADLELVLIDSDGNERLGQAGTFFENGVARSFFTPTETDNTFIRVSGGGFGDGQPIEYEVTFGTEDTIPALPAFAVSLEEGETARSSIEGSDFSLGVADTDVFAPQLTPGLLYEFVLTSPDSDADLELALIDSDGNERLGQAGTLFEAGSARIFFTPTAADDTFIRVSGGGFGDGQPIEYEVTFGTEDTIPDSTATEVSISGGETLPSDLGPLDVDVIALNLVSGLAYELIVRSSGRDFIAEFVEAAGWFSFRLPFETGVARWAFTSTGPGEEFVRLEDFQIFGSIDYEVEIRSEDTVLDSTDTTDIFRVGRARTSALDVETDVDVFAVELVAGDSYAFSLGLDIQAVPSVEQSFQLIDTDGETLASASARPDALARLFYEATHSGMYFLSVGTPFHASPVGYRLVATNEGAEMIAGTTLDDDLLGGGGDDTVKGGTGDDTIDGGDGMDRLNGGAGRDILFGGAGSDELRGSDGQDELFGNDGDDLLLGERQSDTLYGGDGADTLRGGGADDVLYGDAGDDLMFGSSGFDTLFGGDGDDVLDGNQQADELFGETGNDTLRGGDGFDLLDGGEGDDVLAGGNGNDILIGGLGIDTLRGNAQNDTFRFLSVADSAYGAADLIDGIDGVGALGGDLIDLSAIDADTGTAGDQAFTFIGEATTAAGLAGGAGTLWVEEVGGQTRIYGIVENDGTIDLAIRINDGAVLAGDYTAGDFLL